MPERPSRRAIHSPETLGVVDLRREREEGGTRGNMVSPALNQLLRMEEELGDEAVYPGWSAFPRVGR